MTTVAAFAALIIGAFAGAWVALAWSKRNRDDR